MELTKHLSLAVMAVSECSVSISRLQQFLETPELNKTNKQPPLTDDNGDAAIITSHVTCHWNNSGPDNNTNMERKQKELGLIVALDDISVEFDMGTLTCVIGSVGSGKSALIQMLAEELPPTQGTLRRRNGSVAYAPQDPWIMDGTVRENILFGLEFNPERYREVIHACGLDVDLSQLRGGENTIVGDRGVQLSGGQRARIAMARAFYRDADIVLLDDPLSAVDSRVGRLLFYSAIQDLGLKRGKCVVLVTHQHQFIGNYRCIMMSSGRVSCDGSYQQCVEASGGKLTFAAQNHSAEDLTKLDVVPQSEEKMELSEVEEKGTEFVSLNTADINKDDHKEQSKVGVVSLETFLNYSRAMPGGIITGVFMVSSFSVS